MWNTVEYDFGKIRTGTTLEYTFTNDGTKTIKDLKASCSCISLYPNSKTLRVVWKTPEDIKDTGNLSEECNYLFTLFNPNDSKYNLDKHFDLKIRDDFKNPIYPNYRSAHLVESREVICPQHFRYEMYGNVKNFKQLKIK